MAGARRRSDERGVVLPSPVVMLSIVAIAMAAIAFAFTRGAGPTEREVTTISRETTPSATAPASPSEATRSPKPKPKPKPVVQRGQVYVEVYNNSGITGLAGQVATQATDAGWQVVGSDNWYGTIPSSTVYYPPRLTAAAKTLALDLGIQRTAPAVGAMRLDRLTVILTAPLG